MADDPGDEPAAQRALVVSLGTWWLAVAAEDVAAVVRPAPVTPLGGTPAWVAGVAAVRGRVLPVVDVARLAAATSEGDQWWVVVAQADRAAALAGLRVWRVVDAAEPGGADSAPAGLAPPVPGLPAGGAVRLDGSTGRGAAALPPAARRLDAAALLDLVHDPDDPDSPGA